MCEALRRREGGKARPGAVVRSCSRSVTHTGARMHPHRPDRASLAGWLASGVRVCVTVRVRICRHGRTALPWYVRTVSDLRSTQSTANETVIYAVLGRVQPYPPPHCRLRLGPHTFCEARASSGAQ